jgi:hypothetical protein
MTQPVVRNRTTTGPAAPRVVGLWRVRENVVVAPKSAVP